jgi:hypothetical protein
MNRLIVSVFAPVCSQVWQSSCRTLQLGSPQPLSRSQQNRVRLLQAAAAVHSVQQQQQCQACAAALLVAPQAGRQSRHT